MLEFFLFFYKIHIYPFDGSIDIERNQNLSAFGRDHIQKALQLLGLQGFVAFSVQRSIFIRIVLCLISFAEVC